MLMDEIQEIGEMIAPSLYGKSYHELAYFILGEKTKMMDSELFHVCATAQSIRLEAIKAAGFRFKDRVYGWPDLLEICNEIIQRPGVMEKQKELLREKGYLK